VEQKEISDRISEYLSQNKIGGDSFDVKNPRYFLTGIGERSQQEKREDKKVIANSALKAFEQYENKNGRSFFDSLFGVDDSFKEKLKDAARKRRRRSRRGAGDPGITAYGDNIDKAVLSLIASVEAKNYDVFNQSAGKTSGKASEKTIGWLVDNAQGAIGRYQHMPRFLLSRAERAGYDRDTVFTPEVQDKITIKFLYDAHSYAGWRSGKVSDSTFGDVLSATWRGLPHNTGGTYPDEYAGRNKAHITRSDFMAKLAEIRGIDPGRITTTSSTGEYDIIIPLDHVPPNMSGKFPDTDARKSFEQSRATGAAGRERDHQDNAAAKLKAKLDKKGFKVLILKPESFSSYEAYDKYIKQQSAKGVRILPLHFDAEVGKGGIGFLTRTRKGDAEDAAFAAPIQRVLEDFQRNNKKLGGISKDTVGNATVNAGAASPTALVELGAMVQWEREHGKDFTNTSKFDELIQGIADAVEEGTPKRKPSQPQLSSEARQIKDSGTYTVGGVTYDVKTGAPIKNQEISSTESQTIAALAVAMSYEQSSDDAVLLMNMQNRNSPMPQSSQSEIAMSTTKQDGGKLNSALSLYAVGASA